MMVAPSLGDLDALHIRGAERFNTTSRDGLHIRFEADYQDTAPVCSSVVAMDAFKFEDYKETSIMRQISREWMQRDLDKAFVAFRDTEENENSSLKSVFCGSWGQGAPYRGEQEVKVLLQWMAASQNDKDVDFFSTGVLEPLETDALKRLAAFAAQHKCTVQELYLGLAELSATQIAPGCLFSMLYDFLGREVGGHESDGEEESGSE